MPAALLQGGETDASLEAGGEEERPESLLLEAAWQEALDRVGDCWPPSTRGGLAGGAADRARGRGAGRL